jgi:hypothetical protein
MAEIDRKYNQGAGFIENKVIAGVSVPICAEKIKCVDSRKVFSTFMDLTAEQM